MDKDTIYRQDAIVAFDCSIGGVPVESVKYVSEYADKMMSRINALPSAQTEQSIPISWIEKHIEHIKEADNMFATLTAMNISTMVKQWREEQYG